MRTGDYTVSKYPARVSLTSRQIAYLLVTIWARRAQIPTRPHTASTHATGTPCVSAPVRANTPPDLDAPGSFFESSGTLTTGLLPSPESVDGDGAATPAHAPGSTNRPSLDDRRKVGGDSDGHVHDLTGRLALAGTHDRHIHARLPRAVRRDDCSTVRCVGIHEGVIHVGYGLCTTRTHVRLRRDRGSFGEGQAAQRDRHGRAISDRLGGQGQTNRDFAARGPSRSQHRQLDPSWANGRPGTR